MSTPRFDEHVETVCMTRERIWDCDGAAVDEHHIGPFSIRRFTVVDEE